MPSLRVAIYARVSSDQQAGGTIASQIAALEARVIQDGLRLEPDHRFIDDGYSGASLNRPGLDHLRDAVKAAAFERILVTTPDRLARNYVHQMVLLEELERGGCRVECLERPMS